MRVEDRVRDVMSGCIGKMHAKRLDAVIKAGVGVVEAGRLTPAAIGRHSATNTSPKHGIKGIDRLLSNPKLSGERLVVFTILTAVLLRGCRRPVVLVDWTQVMGTHQALVAAVPIGGRSLPVYIEVHRQKKLSNTKVEARFLARLAQVLPSGCRPIIVSDAGFKGPFFIAIRALGWDFLGRIRGTSKAVSLDGEKLVSKDEFYAKATPTPKDLGTFGLFAKQRIPARLVVVRKRRRPGPKRPAPRCKEERELRQSALDPWLLATSVREGDAEHIVRLYGKRMQIEEMFRDAKGHRFGWSLGTVRTGDINRAANLLLIASIAITVVTLVGMAAERSGIHRSYQANTAIRRVLSFFVLGCTIISRNGLSAIEMSCYVAASASLPSRVESTWI